MLNRLKLNSRELKDFFVGTLLGDSYLRFNAFYCKQISKDLIEFKADIIKRHLPGVSVRIESHPERVDKNGTIHRPYYQLITKVHPYFRKLQKEFYPEGKKIVPEKYLRRLSPIGYAMWYADDGTTILVGYNPNSKGAKNRRVQFCTDSFSEREVNSICEVFNSCGWGPAKVLDRKNNQKRIQLPTYKAQSFLIHISPFFENYFPSLLYKIDMGYRNETLDKRQFVSEEYSNLYSKISAHPDFVDRISGREDIV